MPIRAVTFDVDGTLFDLRKMGIAFAWPGIRYARFLKAYLAAREEVRGLGLLEDVRRAQDERVSRALAIPLHEAARLRQHVIDVEWTRAFSRVDPIAGVREALRRMAEVGLKLATISDYRAAPKLRALRLDDLPWSADISAEELGALKPHPRAFLEAIHVLQTPPQEMLHVGDRLDADVSGALACGMRAVLFTGGNGRRYPGEAVPELVFDDYRALLRHLGVSP